MGHREDKLDHLLRDYYKQKHGIREKMEPYAESQAMERCLESPSIIRKARTPRKKPSCPSLSLLGAYIDGTLDEKEKAEIRMHLKRCPDCRDKVQSGLESI